MENKSNNNKDKDECGDRKLVPAGKRKRGHQYTSLVYSLPREILLQVSYVVLLVGREERECEILH